MAGVSYANAVAELTEAYQPQCPADESLWLNRTVTTESFSGHAANLPGMILGLFVLWIVFKLSLNLCPQNRDLVYSAK